MESFKERAVLDWSKDSVRLIVTPSIMAKATFFYVQEIGYFKTKSNYLTEREHLNSYLVIFTVSGKGYLKYKGKSYTILPNMILFIDCMEYQYYETDKDNPWEFLWVHFNGATSHGYYEQFEKNGTPVITVDENSLVPSIMHKLIEVHTNKNIRTEPISSRLIVELLTELILTANAPDMVISYLPQYIKLVMKDMDKRFTEKITLDQMAERFTVSKFYLAKEFKKYTGFTPNEYVINCRITYAKELLKYSNVPVADIAVKIGIDNVSHFINLFKAREDMTPLAFRKKWQSIK